MDDVELEQLARKIAEEIGHDPDRDIYGVPMWVTFIPDALDRAEQ